MQGPVGTPLGHLENWLQSLGSDLLGMLGNLLVLRGVTLQGAVIATPVRQFLVCSAQSINLESGAHAGSKKRGADLKKVESPRNRMDSSRIRLRSDAGGRPRQKGKWPEPEDVRPLLLDLPSNAGRAFDLRLFDWDSSGVESL